MRVVKVACLTLLFLFVWIFWSATAKEKKVKVYLDAPVEVARNEEFALHLMEQMRIMDFEDDTFEFEWVVKATDAEFIISLIADKNKLPVVEQRVPGKYDMCYQWVMTFDLWKKGSGKTKEITNLQVSCDPDEMARRAVIDMVRAMGLKPEWKIKLPGRMQ